MGEPLFPPQAFHLPPGVCHVCAGGESAPLRSHQEAFSQYVTDKSHGSNGRENQNDAVLHARTLLAKSWNVGLGDIGFVSSVAEGVSMVLESLKWRQGDEVCVNKDEFPSLAAPFALRAQHDGKGESGDSKELDSTPEIHIRYTGPETLSTTVTASTRLIAVSYVSYLNGARVDLAFYRRLADSVGAILLVDFTQAAGYALIDASLADFAFSACYKWFLGTTGAAVACWNRKRQPNWKPSTAGWNSITSGGERPSWDSGAIQVRDDAMCFSRGNPAHLSIYILRRGLDFLQQWEPEQILSHAQSLTSELLHRLQQEGITASTPIEKERHGANVAIDCKGASMIVERMGKAGIYAWNGMGRVRFSFHGYNSIQDVERIMEIFPSLWKEFN